MKPDTADSTNAESRIANPGAARIALVAGEVSGDQLGAGLVEALRRRYPNAVFAGIGGEAMRAAGVSTWHDCSELAVMGLTEVLRHLPRLLRLRRALRRRLLAWRPDVFVGIDAPDFNLGLEQRLKQAGVATVHYVSPSIWAWREARAAKIGRSADRVLCLFPIEPPIYARHGVEARFVGHPLADLLPLEPDRAGARRALDLPDEVPVLALLPGSRPSEIHRLAPAFLGAAAILRKERPELRILVPAADAVCFAMLRAMLPDDPGLRLLSGDAHRAMTAADAVLLASGTATLEALLLKRPMVVGYRIAAGTAWLVRRFGLLRTDRYSLPNALSGEDLVPELMQENCTPEALADALRQWFDRPEAVRALIPRFTVLHQQLRNDASEAAATAVAELLR